MDKILEIIREFRPDVDAKNREDLIEGGILDSLDIVNIVSELESEFDVPIPVEEIIPENFNSVSAIQKMIERLEEEN